MAELNIKSDPDAVGASPGGMSDDEMYEDAGDLEFNNGPPFHAMYLAKIPKEMWDAWATLPEDAEIQIGTIRRSIEVGPNGETSDKLHMLLKSDVAAHQTIPKEYMLDVTSQIVKNTFAFTEKDLPGFKSKSRQTFNAATANMPSRLTRPMNDKLKAKEPYDPNKRFQPYVRKAIPKRTSIAGKVAHEVNCISVVNEESERMFATRTTEAMKPKVQTKFVNEDLSAAGSGFIQPGQLNAQNTFSGFIKTKHTTKDGKREILKTARMPQNELLDKLFACFREYNYWSMKSLRAKLQQPEAYIRENLENIAILAKSGRFATHWSLKPTYKDLQNITNQDDAAAPVVEGADESDMADEEDDDDEVKFEDV